MARRYVFPFEVERGDRTAEYELHYSVSPAEPQRGPSYSSGGEPGCDPSVEDREAFYLRDEPCQKHRFNRKERRRGCSDCKKVPERRPELDDFVDDDELLVDAGETEEGEASAAADHAVDRARDARMDA